MLRVSVENTFFSVAEKFAVSVLVEYQRRTLVYYSYSTCMRTSSIVFLDRIVARHLIRHPWSHLLVERETTFDQKLFWSKKTDPKVDHVVDSFVRVFSVCCFVTKLQNMAKFRRSVCDQCCGEVRCSHHAHFLCCSRTTTT